MEKGLDGFKMRCGLQEFEKDVERVSLVQEYIAKTNTNLNKEIYLMIDFIQGTSNLNSQ